MTATAHGVVSSRHGEGALPITATGDWVPIGLSDPDGSIGGQPNDLDVTAGGASGAGAAGGLLSPYGRGPAAVGPSPR